MENRDETKIGAKERIIFACAFWLLSLYMVVLAPYFSVGAEWTGLVSSLRIGIWIGFIGFTLRFFLIYVPTVTGVVAQDLLRIVKDPDSGERMEMKTFGPGLHLRFPWDVVIEKNIVSLTRMTQEFQEDYPTREGPMMNAKCSYQYHPDARRLQKYIAVDEKTIRGGFTDVNSSILAEEIFRLTKAEDVKEQAKGIERRVFGRIDGDPAVTAGKHVTMKEKLEEEYGINFKIFTIRDLDFAKDFQEMRAARARMDRFGDITKDLKEKLTTRDGNKVVIDTISNKDAANLVQVDQGKTQKNIFELEGSGIASAILSFLAKVVPKGA
jgi:regulator of protease activity HflC (stomatin/prohibitin superfamily)